MPSFSGLTADASLEIWPRATYTYAWKQFLLVFVEGKKKAKACNAFHDFPQTDEFFRGTDSLQHEKMGFIVRCNFKRFVMYEKGISFFRRGQI